MTADLDPYDYIISIGEYTDCITMMNAHTCLLYVDLGSTFSGSCYTCIRNKDTIVHVTKW